MRKTDGEQLDFEEILKSWMHTTNDFWSTMRLYRSVQRDFPEDFLEDFLMIIKALANQGGPAIQNAAIYLPLQEDKANLEKNF